SKQAHSSSRPVRAPTSTCNGRPTTTPPTRRGSRVFSAGSTCRPMTSQGGSWAPRAARMRGHSRSAITQVGNAQRMRRVFLGIDCGTQSTKVVLRDPDTGEIVSLGRAPHELIERDDGTREQDPKWWIDALRTAVRDALRG